jgi:hypothetical protein
MPKHKTRFASEQAIRKMLARYDCPVPYHQVRTRFLGAIACPGGVVPLEVAKSLWGGALPPVDSLEDLNEMLAVLMMGLWNELTAHDNPRIRFRACHVPLEPTPANLDNFGKVRAQEVEGFIEGLFNGEDETELPKRAHDAAKSLSEIRSMMLAVTDLVERTAGLPEDRAAIKETIQNLRKMTEIMEIEMQAAVVSGARLRAMGLAPVMNPQETRH